MHQPLTAGIELGGTKCVALVARGQEILAITRVATTSPASTLTALSDWLQARHAELPFVALGIASFGPLGLDPLVT